MLDLIGNLLTNQPLFKLHGLNLLSSLYLYCSNLTRSKKTSLSLSHFFFFFIWKKCTYVQLNVLNRLKLFELDVVFHCIQFTNIPHGKPAATWSTCIPVAPPSSPYDTLSVTRLAIGIDTWSGTVGFARLQWPVRSIRRANRYATLFKTST